MKKPKAGKSITNYEFRIATSGIPSRKDVAVQNNIRGIIVSVFSLLILNCFPSESQT